MAEQRVHNIKHFLGKIIEEYRASVLNKSLVDRVMIINENVWIDGDTCECFLRCVLDFSFAHCMEKESIIFMLTQQPMSTAGYASFECSVMVANSDVEQQMIPTLLEKEPLDSLKRKINGLGGTIIVSHTGEKGFQINVKFAAKLEGKEKKLSGIEAAVNKEIEGKTHSKKVLLVEDNDLNRELSKEVLETVGFEVVTAGSGKNALELLQSKAENYFDLILMDISMPEKDGYETTRDIRNMGREDLKNIPIYALSSFAMEEDKELAAKNGMNGHFAKPLNARILTDLAEKMKRA